MTKKNILKLITFMFIFLFSGIPAHGAEPDENDILVIGTGEIYNNNLASARKDAISDALVKGIEDYLKTTLSSQGMINNFHEIISEIIPGSSEVIENYSILADDESEDKYRILVSVKVNEKLMEEKLRDYGIIIFEGPALRVLFLVSNRDNPEEELFLWWDDPENKNRLSSAELILHRLLQERGFRPANRLITMPEAGYNQELFKEELTIEEAAEWGKLYSSDLVILGRVDTADYNSTEVDLKAINAETASVISSFSHEILLHDGEIDETEDPVMNPQEKILNEAVAFLTPEILMSFKKEEEKVTEFGIELRGMDSLKQVFSLISLLEKDIKGVISVVQTRIKRDVLSLSIEFTGSRETFIRRLEQSADLPFPVYINIENETNILTINAR